MNTNPMSITGTEKESLGWCVTSAISMPDSIIRLYGTHYGEIRGNNTLMAREVSANGNIVWERELMRSDCAPDWGQLSEASVIRHEGKWILYCWNQEQNRRSGIYIYTSDDGLTWKPSRFNPAITSINDSISTFISHSGELLCYQQLWALRHSPGLAGFHSLYGKPHWEKPLIKRKMGILYGKANNRMTMFENLVGPVFITMPAFESVQLYKLIPFKYHHEYRGILWSGDADDFRCWDSLRCHMIRSSDGLIWEDLGLLPPGRWTSAPVIHSDGSSWWWKERDGIFTCFNAEETQQLLKT